MTNQQERLIDPNNHKAPNKKTSFIVSKKVSMYLISKHSTFLKNIEFDRSSIPL